MYLYYDCKTTNHQFDRPAENNNRLALLHFTTTSGKQLIIAVPEYVLEKFERYAKQLRTAKAVHKIEEANKSNEERARGPRLTVKDETAHDEIIMLQAIECLVTDYLAPIEETDANGASVILSDLVRLWQLGSELDSPALRTKVENHILLYKNMDIGVFQSFAAKASNVSAYKWCYNFDKNEGLGHVVYQYLDANLDTIIDDDFLPVLLQGHNDVSRLTTELLTERYLLLRDGNKQQNKDCDCDECVGARAESESGIVQW